MTRIGAHLTGFERQLLNRLSEANGAAAINSLRLATGFKVNSPSDDPAAFFELSSLRSRLSTVNNTIGQVTSATNVVSQAQLTLDQIRTQLNSIRTALVTDEDRGLSAPDRAGKQAEIDTAIAQINTLARSEINGKRILDGSADFDVTGRNSSQVESVRVYSVGGATQTVAGEQAELTYTGSNRTIAADTSITITGSLGATDISFKQGDTLEDAAGYINARVATTGVTATVDNNELTLNSVGIGTLATVSVVVNTGAFAVTGGVGDGTDKGVDTVMGTGPAISGKVLEAATRASLVYTGSSGQIIGNATFSITGVQGSTAITVTASENLSDVADRVNQYSHKTGITAVASGDSLTFTTVEFGTAATVDVSVSSGTFAVTGGNGDGTAQGTNAVAEINGRTITGNQAATAAGLLYTSLASQIDAGTDFVLTGNDGNYTFSFGSDTTLTSAASTINNELLTTGVKATVSADGFDLILSSATQGVNSLVQVDVTAGTLNVEARDGSSVTSNIPAQQGELLFQESTGLVTNAAVIRITGNTSVNSGDITLTVGQTLNSVAQSINAEKANTGVEAKIVGDQLVIYSQATGDTQFAQVEVQSGTFAFTGGDVNGKGFGVDPLTAVSGADAITSISAVDGNEFIYNQGGLRFSVEFAADFTGTFDTISVADTSTLTFALTTNPSLTDTLAIRGVQAIQLGGPSGNLEDLLSGGLLAGLDGNTSQAIRVVDEAIAQLTLIEGSVDGFADAAIASSSALLTGFKDTLEDSIDNLDAIDEGEESLLLAKNRQLANNALSAMTILSQQRSSIVAIIQQIAGL